MSGAEPASRPKPAGAAQRAAPRRRRAPDYHFTAAGLVLNSQKPCIHFGEEPPFSTNPMTYSTDTSGSRTDG